jgi:alpha-D-ribose 1-methylphosphonate 5-triphosphate diphosphatase
MGAPNLIRGGSHVGYMSVAAAAQAGVLDCLCSDYHYPSLFHAPFKMAEMGLMSFEESWKLVSTHPAQAAGIADRKGAIAAGLEADFLLIKPGCALPSAIAAVYVKGQEVARYA